MNEHIAPKLILAVDGQRWGGWVAGTVERSIETASGAFQLDLTERWPDDGGPRPIAAGSRCTVQLAGETVITGYIDAIDVTYDAGSHALSVRGRDAAGDLVDCSADALPGEWRGLSLLDIARDIARPFGVRVKAIADVGRAVDTFRIDPGETCWSAIERLCRFRGVLCMSDGRGGLTLMHPGEKKADVRLVRGENILTGRLSDDHGQRHSHYIVKGQRPRVDGEDADLSAHVVAEATDPGIRRYRPLLVMAEDQADTAAAQTRARWEAAVRAGRGRRIDITVQGWRQTAGGRLWQPGERVQIDCNWLRPEGDMIIAGVRHQVGPQGSTTELSLLPPSAFLPEPLVAPKPEAAGRKSKKKSGPGAVPDAYLDGVSK